MTGTLQINVPTATDEGLILKSTDNSTTDYLLEIQNSTGGLIWGMKANGDIISDSYLNRDDNIFFGNGVAGAGNLTTNGYYNVAVGYQWLLLTTGARNSLWGWKSGYTITTGTDNMAVGYNTCSNIQTGVDNVSYWPSSVSR